MKATLANFNGQMRTVLTALFLSCSCGAAADDTELFLSQGGGVAPNVLFVLDTSGSMRREGASGASRIEEMQSALRQLINSVSGVNMGILRFSRDPRIVLEQPIDDIETSRDDLLQAVDDLDPRGGTETLDALFTARQYFAGNHRENSNLVPSPIALECQQNHIVLVTDGQPDDNPPVVSEVEAVIGECADRTIENNEGDVNNGNCGEELADYLFTTDQSESVANSTVFTHTIGFNFDDPWLGDIASAGGGQNFNVTAPSALLDAFNSIFNSFSSTFAAPTVSVDSFNESRHSDEIYYSQFQPFTTVRWNGNVKKYRLLDGVLVDSREAPLLLADNSIDPNSQSLWADAADGAAVADGGFAARLPDFDKRNWFTDYNVGPGADGRITPFKLTTGNFNSLPPLDLGVATLPERNELLLWALGSDVENNEDDTNHFVADALHNSPVVLSYFAERDGPTRQEVVFTADNLGVLHAIDVDTGTELWAYQPEEHLLNIKEYFNNEAGDHVYGLDGSFTLHSTRQETDLYDFLVDEAWLFMTERRGGNRMYGLDVTNGFRPNDPFNIMWKITGGTEGPLNQDTNGDGQFDSHAFRDLAQTWSKPELIPVRYGCPENCETKDLLMFGGGYNPDYDDVTLDYDTYTRPADGHGNAVYLIDPETGELVWSVGNGAHHSLDLPIDHSVPSTPVIVDNDLDGAIDIMFFVDISGDVWRVDFDTTADNTDQLHLSGGKIAELSPAGESQRFYNPIDITRSSNNVSTSFFSLVTGSGIRARPLFEEPHNNRLYVIRDRFVFEPPTRRNPATGEVEPDYRYVTDNFGNHNVITSDSDVLRDVNDEASTTTTEFGLFRTHAPGEKILQPTLLTLNRAFSVVYVPPETAGNGCAFGIGETRLFITGLDDGANLIPDSFNGPYILVGDGLLANGQLVDTGEGGAPYFLVDTTAIPLDELTAPDSNSSVFRRFRRTGWVEQDEY